MQVNASGKDQDPSQPNGSNQLNKNKTKKNPMERQLDANSAAVSACSQSLIKSNIMSPNLVGSIKTNVLGGTPAPQTFAR